MSENSNFDSAWSDYRNRRRWFFGVWLGGVPLVVLLSLALIPVFHSEIPFYVVAGAFFFGFAVVGVRLTLFRCPHCHRHFFFTGYSSNHFAKRCVHCGFPKWAKTDSDEHSAA
jgi:hypothetical protein